MTPSHAIRSLRVNIVGINYEPEPTGIAPYTTGLAKALAARGHVVRVFCGVPHYPTWTVPADLRFRLRNRQLFDGVTVTRLRHFVPRRQSALSRGWYELTFAAQVAQATARECADITVAVSPTLLSSLVAMKLPHSRSGRKLLWVQDLVSAAAQQSGIRGGSSVTSAVRLAERASLLAADSVIFIDERMANALAPGASLHGTVSVIPNWTHIASPSEARDSVRARYGWKPDELVVVHAGNMGLKQGLEHVVDAARISASSHRIKWIFAGDGSQKDQLQKLAADLSSVCFIGIVPGSEFPNILAAADVLLVHQAPEVREMSLPSKLTSYQFTGTPIACAATVGSPTQAAAAMISNCITVAPGNPSALVDCVVGASMLERLPARSAAGLSSLAALVALVEEAGR